MKVQASIWYSRKHQYFLVSQVGILSQSLDTLLVNEDDANKFPDPSIQLLYAMAVNLELS